VIFGSTVLTGAVAFGAATVYVTLLLADVDRPLTVLVDRTVRVFAPVALVGIAVPSGTAVPFPKVPTQVTVPVPVHV
jgi:hypothetical protein